MIRFSTLSDQTDAASNVLYDQHPPLKGMRAQAGTTNAPTISFANDIDTGIFSPSENTLSIVTGGQTRLQVDGTGTTTLYGDMLPLSNANQYIGSSNIHFKEAWIDTVYISSNTLYIGDTPVIGTDQDSIAIRADIDKGITLQTTGLGETNVTSTKGVTVTASGTNSVVDVESTGTGGRVVMGATNEIVMTAPTTTVGSNLTVSGNLVLNGGKFVANVQTVNVKDNIILLNSGETGTGVTRGDGRAGLRVDRGTATDHHIVFNEASDKFEMGPVDGANNPIASESYVNSRAIDTSYIVSGTLGADRGGTGTTSSTGTGSLVKESGATLDGTTFSNSTLLGGTLSNMNLSRGTWSNTSTNASLKVGNNTYLAIDAPMHVDTLYNAARPDFGALHVGRADQHLMFLSSNGSIMDTMLGANARNSLRITSGYWTDCNYNAVYDHNGITIDVGGSTDGRQNVASNAGTILCLNTARNGVVMVGSNLNVGANAYSSFGDVYASSTLITSDDRLKENERYITNATETINKLRPQIYDKKIFIDGTTYNTEDPAQDPVHGPLPPNTPVKESGLIAQEVFYDAPELRHLVTLPDDANSNALYTSSIQSSTDPSIDPSYTDWGAKAANLNYVGLIPYLVKSIQEKDSRVRTLKAKLDTMQ